MAIKFEWLYKLIVMFKEGRIARMELVDAIFSELANSPSLEEETLSHLRASQDPEICDVAVRVHSLIHSK